MALARRGELVDCNRCGQPTADLAAHSEACRWQAWRNPEPGAQ